MLIKSLSSQARKSLILLHHEKAPKYGTICEGDAKVEKQRYIFVGKGEYNVVTIQNFPTVYVLNISPFPLDLN